MTLRCSDFDSMTIPAHDFIDATQRHHGTPRMPRKTTNQERMAIQKRARGGIARFDQLEYCTEAATRKPSPMRTWWLAAAVVENPRHRWAPEPQKPYRCGLSLVAARMSIAFVQGSSCMRINRHEDSFCFWGVKLFAAPQSRYDPRGWTASGRRPHGKGELPCRRLRTDLGQLWRTTDANFLPLQTHPHNDRRKVRT